MFRLQDYCWSDHGYALVRRFYPGAAGLLDEQFTVAETMTYHTYIKMALFMWLIVSRLHDSRNVNTDSFRRAIWYYTQRVLGMINDDYDYRVVCDRFGILDTDDIGEQNNGSCYKSVYQENRLLS